MLITDVADKPAKARVISKLLTNFILLEFVAREDDHASRIVALEQLRDERLAKGSGTARN